MLSHKKMTRMSFWIKHLSPISSP
ncbi:hypothetical protein Patl1_36959 [Pistacia atlantica]|nr:hypothetical protein Patl1_36959 [Pistacia atlantica]